MRKTILIFSLLLLSPVAGLAQVVKPPCYPMVNGAHLIAPRHFYGEHGQHVFWACSARAGGAAKVYGFSCLHGECSAAALHAAHTSILAATAKLTAANAAWDTHVKFDCPEVLAEQTPRGRMCREREAFIKVMEAGK